MDDMQQFSIMQFQLRIRFYFQQYDGGLLYSFCGKIDSNNLDWTVYSIKREQPMYWEISMYHSWYISIVLSCTFLLFIVKHLANFSVLEYFLLLCCFSYKLLFHVQYPMRLHFLLVQKMQPSLNSFCEMLLIAYCIVMCSFPSRPYFEKPGIESAKEQLTLLLLPFF